MPKRELDYMNCEVMRFYKLNSKGMVEPISMTVPRKVGAPPNQHGGGVVAIVASFNGPSPYYMHKICNNTGEKSSCVLPGAVCYQELSSSAPGSTLGYTWWARLAVVS